MFQLLRGFVLVAAMLFYGGASFAEDLDSANSIMNGCRPFVAGTPSGSLGSAFQKGVCVGTVDTIVETAQPVCIPKGATTMQAVRIVVKYIDDRPARMHENFRVLAREALTEAWPCWK